MLLFQHNLSYLLIIMLDNGICIKYNYSAANEGIILDVRMKIRVDIKKL